MENNKNKIEYKYRPKNKRELVEAIRKEIYEVQGTKDNPNWKADLNCIDTSFIEDMSNLFNENKFFINFNGDISQWDVSKVKTMENMFGISSFNGDISTWDVSNVRNMAYMFTDSKFNQPLDKWNTKNVKTMAFMFAHSSFNQDISSWDLSNVEDLHLIDLESKIERSSYVKEAIILNY